MAIGTAAAISAGVSLASTGMSISQAAQARRARDEADREAKRFIEEAERQMEINPFEALAIQKEPYEMAMDAAIEAAAIESQALAEADPRYLAGLAARRRMGQEEALQGVRTAMGQEMLNLDKMAAAEEARLRDQRTNLMMGQASAQTREADIQDIMRQQAIASAVGSFGQAAESIGKGLELSKGEKERAVDPRFQMGQATGSETIPVSTETIPVSTGTTSQPNVQTGLLGGSIDLINQARAKYFQDMLRNMSTNEFMFPSLNPFNPYTGK